MRPAEAPEVPVVPVVPVDQVSKLTHRALGLRARTKARILLRRTAQTRLAEAPEVPAETMNPAKERTT